MKKLWIVMPFLAISAFTVHAANVEEKRRVEVPGDIAVQIEESQRVTLPEKIEPDKDIKMPEVPQPVREGKAAGAAQVRADKVEDAQATGVITETEATLEKDSVKREANLKF